MWCIYNIINFLLNPHNRHTIARLWRWDMGCLLWVPILIYVLSQLLLCCMQYHFFFWTTLQEHVTYQLPQKVRHSHVVNKCLMRECLYLNFDYDEHQLYFKKCQLWDKNLVDSDMYRQLKGWFKLNSCPPGAAYMLSELGQHWFR